MKKGVLIARFTTKAAAIDVVNSNNEVVSKNVLYYIHCWVDGALPYAVIKVVDVEGED